MSLIGRVEDFLKRWRLLSPYTRDDMLNASTEDALRVYEMTVADFRRETHNRLRGNEHLRKALRLAKERTQRTRKVL